MAITWNHYLEAKVLYEFGYPGKKPNITESVIYRETVEKVQFLHFCKIR
jgi:hypothetical protein